jgi:hypothetical protein
VGPSARDAGLFIPVFSQREGILVPRTASLNEYQVGTSGLAVPTGLAEGRMAAYPTGQDLGLPVHTYEQLVDMVRELPFEMAMRATATLQAALCHRDNRFSGAVQLKLARRLMPGSWVLGPLGAWVAEPDRVIFSEQALFALQRLLILYSPPDPTRLFDDLLHEQFMQAVLATPGAVLERARQPVSPSDWTAYLMRGGHFYGREGFEYLLARHHHLWHDLAPQLETDCHRDACPIHDWYQGVFGRSILEDEALALAVMAGAIGYLSNKPAAWVAEGELPENPLVVGRDTLLAESALASRAPALFGGISATQEEFRGEFALGERDPEAAAWDFLPFAKRPLVAIADGSYVPVSPRLLETWATSGVYHRLGEAAKRRGGDSAYLRFTRCFGEVVERYARELLSSSLDGGPALARRVLPPERYRGAQGEKETSDAIIDCAPDLVLVEVVSGRIGQGVLVRAEQAAAERDLERLIYKKAAQIACVATDLRNGSARVGAFAGSPPRRLFPVIVSTEGITQAPLLRAALEARLAASWSSARLEPLLLLGLEELEQLTSQLRCGVTLVEVLGRATSPRWREHGYSAYLNRDPSAPTPPLNPDIERLWVEASEAVNGLLFPASAP